MLYKSLGQWDMSYPIHVASERHLGVSPEIQVLLLIELQISCGKNSKIFIFQSLGFIQSYKFFLFVTNLLLGNA